MNTQTFDVVDLINLVAADHDWDLLFDSGPGDGRELIFSRRDGFGVGLEVAIVLDFTGRIECSECRRDGVVVHRYAVDTGTSSGDVQVMTLGLFRG